MTAKWIRACECLGGDTPLLAHGKAEVLYRCVAAPAVFRVAAHRRNRFNIYRKRLRAKFGKHEDEDDDDDYEDG